MCHLCDYPELLEKSGLGATSHRLKVLEIIGNNNSPLSAREIYNTLNRTDEINRVTVYRILERLVESGLIDRISSGGRSFRYGLAPNENHEPHAHFYCTECGNLECLNPESLRLDMDPIQRTFPGKVRNVQIRLDGLCKTCLQWDREVLH
jgi:Fur family ferric uptake transcriptional regulator